MESNNQQSFFQFSDELRVHTSNLANLSLNDSIWSVNSYPTKKTEDRRNFDIRVGGNLEPNPKPKGNFVNNNNTPLPNNSDFNSFNNGWKLGSGINLNGGFNKGIYSKGSMGHISNQNDQFLRNFNVNVNNNNNNVNNNNNNNNNNVGLKGHKNVALKGDDIIGGGKGKKNKEVKKENNNKDSNSNNGDSKSGVDKRFKTLPPSEALPRNETVGGYIFVCNNDTMEENLKRHLFGLPPRYRDSVRQITPGLPLFLYNYSTHQLHGIYEAASFGGTNIDPSAWEDKKNPGESRFPAQVRVQSRKLCEPLDEDAFRPILHHYDGPKFRLELSVPEALSLLDIFDETKA
ncbi:B2 protein-like [Chenopodium quinoa]|uniref:B2 protein-like n=1 Tax=Chenopodium quinoa TaxID=63459 RepID=UPI000B79A315|nr:B2 protein-like [Chenopodium quinoa]